MATKRAWGTLGMALLGAALVTVIGIAAGGGSPVASGPRTRRIAPPVTLRPDPEQRPSPRPTEAADDTLLLVLRIFVVLCLGALVVAVIVIVIRLLLGRPELGLRRRVMEPEEVSELTIPLVPGPIVASPASVADTVSRAHNALLDGADVREAIIVAWLRLENLADAAGTSRLDSDAPGDLVQRLLGDRQVRRRSLEQLAELYRRARYSPAAMGEDERAAALRALHDVRSDLESPTAAGSGQRWR
jgi:hypothetical protein